MKVLLAEDEQISREMLNSLLTRWGYEVITATDGNDAWAILDSDEAPPIALVDWMMPGMTGLEICNKVREKGTDCYIIMITGNHSHQELEQVIEAGADDYVHKGGLPQEILLRLRAAETISILQEEVKASRKKGGWRLFSFRSQNAS